MADGGKDRTGAVEREPRAAQRREQEHGQHGEQGDLLLVFGDDADE